MTMQSDSLPLIIPNTMCVDELMTRDYLDLGKADPAILKDILGYAGLADTLFPGIVTGVTCWPFLCVANTRDPNNTFRKVIARIRKLAKEGQCIKYGPGARTVVTVLPTPYRSAWESIDESGSELARFLKRIRFNGNPSVFKRSREWRTALRNHVSPGGKQFLNMIWKDRTRTRYNEVTPFYEVIGAILRGRPPRDDCLYHAAFCYAFFNCVYGIRGDDPKRKARDIADTCWPKTLLKGIEKGWLPVRIMSGTKHKLISLLEKADKEKTPPLLKVAQKATGEDRPVNFSARLYSVYRLYAYPTPKRLQKFVEAQNSS